LPRRILVIAAAVVVIALAALVYLLPHQSNVASAPRSTPSSKATASAAPLSCQPTELKLDGAFQECAAIDKAQSCPASFDQPKVVLLHGAKHDFLIYIELNGAYHGPGTYALVPWPHESLGVSDGVAKVAIREYVTGRLYESSAGSITIDNLQNSGYVYAGLGASPNSPVQVELNIAGWWSCS
jgi:hypothetical protein